MRQNTTFNHGCSNWNPTALSGYSCHMSFLCESCLFLITLYLCLLYGHHKGSISNRAHGRVAAQRSLEPTEVRNACSFFITWKKMKRILFNKEQGKKKKKRRVKSSIYQKRNVCRQHFSEIPLRISASRISNITCDPTNSAVQANTRNMAPRSSKLSQQMAI